MCVFGLLITVKETRSEIIFYLLVLFLLILLVFFPCGFLVVFGFFIGKRFGCKRLSEPEFVVPCHQVREVHSGRGSRDCDKDDWR